MSLQLRKALVKFMILDRRSRIAIVQMSSNRLFPMKIESIQSCLMAEVKDPSWLWHFRKTMVIGLPEITVPSLVCEDCVVSKQHRSQFPKGKSWRAKDVLELVHSDICGPINPSSNGGKRYLITFIDDFSRKTWVYFLQEKSEALTMFTRFKAFVENEAGKTIKSLRTDRGGEYCSKEFEGFCMQHGIRRELTAAHTPQQNGVSERKNRTILNMVRTLLTRGRVPRTFWPEAVNWSIHVLNRSPTFAVQNKTPEEAWSGRRPVVDHFRIFGCLAYAHIPDAKRKKLDDKAEKCIFLGVSESSKAYKLFNPLTKKIVTSRDVVFEEESTWDWDGQQPKQVLYDDDAKQEQVPALVMPQNSSDTTQTATGISQPVAEVNEKGAQSVGQVRRRPAWMEDYEVTGLSNPITHFALFADCDPTTFESAVKEEKWQKAMDDEINSIEKNDTWELCDLPKGHKTIGVKWVFKTKLNKNSGVDKYKARLVAKGYK